MKEVSEKANQKSKKSLLKLFIFILFIIAAIILVRFTGLKNFLSAKVLGDLVDSAGIFAPLIFILVYTAGTCLFVPGTILTGLGAAIFGAYWGFLYVWIGAMFGSSMAFLIGRTLGRDFAASLIGNKLQKYDDAIERNGFATTLYLRLLYFPFAMMNFGMGLTKVRFLDYFAGTGLGIIVGTFLFTFFIGTLIEVWSSGDWEQLISLKVIFSLALFIFSFFIPKIIVKIKGEK